MSFRESGNPLGHDAVAVIDNDRLTSVGGRSSGGGQPYDP